MEMWKHPRIQELQFKLKLLPGGLIAAASIGVLGMSIGAAEARKALKIEPIAFAGMGVILAGASGLLSALIDAPFMTSIWMFFNIGDTEIALSTPMFFDIGVYLVVFGTLSAVALALEGGEEEEGV